MMGLMLPVVKPGTFCASATATEADSVLASASGITLCAALSSLTIGAALALLYSKYFLETDMSVNNKTRCHCDCRAQDTVEKVQSWLTLLVEILNVLPYWLSLIGVCGLFFYNRVIHNSLSGLKGKTEVVISDLNTLKSLMKE